MKKYLLLGITIVAAYLALAVVTVAAVGLMPTFPVYFPGCQNTDWEYSQEGKNSVACNSEVTYSFPSISGKIARAGSYKVNNQAFAHNLPEIFFSNDLDRPKRYSDGPPLVFPVQNICARLWTEVRGKNSTWLLPLYNRSHRSAFHNISSLEERIRCMTWHIAMEFP